MAGTSPATIVRTGKNGRITAGILLKIWIALNCNVKDIIEIVNAEVRSQWPRQRQSIFC